MQHAIAKALNWHAHQVQVECRRMGRLWGKRIAIGAVCLCGGGGGLAAQRPVKLRLDRDDDFMITGRRHCFVHQYRVGYDNEGRIQARIDMISARRLLG